MGGKNWFKITGVSKNQGFKKLGVKLHSLMEANPRETCHGSKNWDSTVFSMVIHCELHLQSWSIQSMKSIIDDNRYQSITIDIQGCCLGKIFGSPSGSQNQKLGAQLTFLGAQN